MKNVRYLFTTLCLVLLTGLAGITGSAIASTPDGETPANEGVCDPLKADGITKGLYGLCVAYCEAQDLDSVDKEPPSTKILENYKKKKTATDPGMPCVKSPCPCWSYEEMASITADGMAAACLPGTGSLRIIDNNLPIGQTRYALANIDRDLCTFVDSTITPITVNIKTTLTHDEALSCYAAVTQACTDVGL
jgi:hypothetical protein